MADPTAVALTSVGIGLFSLWAGFLKILTGWQLLDVKSSAQRDEMEFDVIEQNAELREELRLRIDSHNALEQELGLLKIEMAAMKKHLLIRPRVLDPA
jgi:hypothetical protein